MALAKFVKPFLKHFSVAVISYLFSMVFIVVRHLCRVVFYVEVPHYRNVVLNSSALTMPKQPVYSVVFALYGNVQLTSSTSDSLFV